VAVKQISAESSVAPNLVPMVDIMFLLLLFFMLGADMGQRELEEVKLPIANSTKEEKSDDTDPSAAKRMTINVYHDFDHCSGYEATMLCADRSHWAIGIRGNDFGEGKEAELKAFLEGEVQNYKEQSGEKIEAPVPGKLKPPCEMRVMIRADQAALYEYVQRP